MQLVVAIGAKDASKAARHLRAAPHLARAALGAGATREDAKPYYFESINHYVYAGDTPLHAAAASHLPALVQTLLEFGADVGARNRRGAQALHYAADGVPGSPQWDPPGQVAVIEALVAAGADPNCRDKSGVAPLHRAVRARCAAAVRALLESGADPNLTNGAGSSPMKLATRPSGRGGSGSQSAHEQQAMVIQVLESYGAEP
ncbi:MAG TPA: ankyrin repeat domain-containing protein [Acidimicrobiales bacterium]|nr:ankyrin repeat domain-containing protein [Acidimicrobiales bacterium]